jgi:hypothetical protein
LIGMPFHARKGHFDVYSRFLPSGKCATHDKPIESL